MRHTLFALLAFGDARAHWIDKQGNTFADTEDRKSIGSLGAEIFFTTDAEVLGDHSIFKRTNAIAPCGSVRP